MCLPGSESRQGWGLTDWSSDKRVMVEREGKRGRRREGEGEEEEE